MLAPHINKAHVDTTINIGDTKAIATSFTVGVFLSLRFSHTLSPPAKAAHPLATSTFTNPLIIH